jgi:hypothetical protein
VWRDLRDLDPTKDFSVEIENPIFASDAIVVCITPSIARASERFVRREILYEQTKRKPIIPVRFDAADVPILINHLTWVEGGSRLGSVGLDCVEELIEFYACLPSGWHPLVRPIH